MSSGARRLATTHANRRTFAACPEPRARSISRARAEWIECRWVVVAGLPVAGHRLVRCTAPARDEPEHCAACRIAAACPGDGNARTIWAVLGANRAAIGRDAPERPGVAVFVHCPEDIATLAAHCVVVVAWLRTRYRIEERTAVAARAADKRFDRIDSLELTAAPLQRRCLETGRCGSFGATRVYQRD